MRVVVATQRVIEPDRHGEVREGLDLRWSAFFRACGLSLLPLPNDPSLTPELVHRVGAVGVLLTGGGDLQRYGGTHEMRQRTEDALVAQAKADNRPVLGVCRGMQFLLDRTGVHLKEVDGHTGTRHAIDGPGHREVNSAHHLSATEVGQEWIIKASAGAAVEAVQHITLPWCGMMWHPERESPFHEDDVSFFRHWFGGGA